MNISKLKTTTFLLSLAALAAFTASCSKEDGPAVPEGTSRLDVAGLYSRAPSGESTPLNGDCALVLLDGSGQSYGGVHNPVRAAYLSEGVYNIPEILLTETPGLLHAFHPYGTELRDGTLRLDLLTRTDYLASAAPGISVDYRNRKVQRLELHHLLARIGVQVDGYPECTLSVTGYPYLGSYSLSSGTFSIESPTATLASPSSSLLVFPGSIKDYKALVTCGGEEFSYYFPEQELEGGKEYRYRLKVSREGKLELEGITVTAWQDGGEYEIPVRPE